MGPWENGPLLSFAKRKPYCERTRARGVITRLPRDESALDYDYFCPERAIAI